MKHALGRTVGCLLLLCTSIGSIANAQTLTGLAIFGPSEINEGQGANYNVRATFSNGLTFDVTLFSEFSLHPEGIASINQFGQLTTSDVDGDTTLTITAQFTWDAVTKTATREVVIIDQSPLSCASPDYTWGRNWGGTGVETVRHVWTDGLGNAFVCGSYEGTVDFDPTAGVDLRTSVGGSDVFVTKLLSTGAYGWTRTFGGSESDVATSLAVGLDGSVYVTGDFSGTVDFDPGNGQDIKTAAGSTDVFVSRLSAAGDYLWSRTVGAGFADNAYDIAVDVHGNCIVAGAFQGTADFDPGPGVDSRRSAGNRDIFAWSLDASGQYRWAYTVGNKQSDEALGVVVTPTRDVYLTGRFSTIVDFDPGPAQWVMQVWGVTDVFLVKLSPEGAFQWARSFGGVSTDGAYRIARAENGDLVLGGYFWDTVDFDPGPGTYNLTSAGQSDGFVARYTEEGAFVWARRVGGPLNEEVFDVATDPEGRVLATGYFAGTVDFDTGPGVANLTSAGNEDAFVLKLGSSGSFNWAVGMGGSQTDHGRSLAADGAGRITAAGTFRGTANLNPVGNDTRTALGQSDAFVVRLQCGQPIVESPFSCVAPTYLGSIAAGGPGSDATARMWVDPDGAYYLGGAFSGTVDFNPSPTAADLHTAIGGTDVFVTRFNPDGSYAWTRTIGGTGNDTLGGLASRMGDGVYFAGSFSGAVDFDPGPGQNVQVSNGVQDIFVAKLDHAGNFLWARTAGGLSDDRVYRLAVSPHGSVYIAGAFQNTVDFNPGPSVANFTSRGSFDAYVWSLDSAGNYRWTYAVGGTQIDEAYGVDVDWYGRVAVVGRFQTIVDFDSGPGVYPLTSNGATDAFLARLDDSGQLVWARGIGGLSTESATGVAIALNGDIVIGGTYWGTVDFDPGPGVVSRTAIGFGDVFVARFTSDGLLKWVRVAGGNATEELNAIALDPGGNVAATGVIRGPTNFDPGASNLTLTTAGGDDAYVWRIADDGAVAWAVTLGGTGSDLGYDVWCDGAATVGVCGAFSGSANLNPVGVATYTAAGASDGFATWLQCGTGLIGPTCVGDLNCDGVVNFAEIDLFIVALEGQMAWLAQFPDCPWLNADCNLDLNVSFDDIDPFIELLGAVCPGTAGAAEPAIVVPDAVEWWKSER